MRAVCEVCDQPQPIDWKAGDLCIHCGQAVRHDVRCFWCAKWTPAGKFCRRCGAAVVDERQYGAARMLKDAGSDRFTIPKMLLELDPEQIDNFTQIYQRHAAVMQRHVDHLRFLETFLYQRHWSEDLQEQLVSQLPWPEERLDALSKPATAILAGGTMNRDEKLAAATAIQTASPFDTTRSLATVARFLLDDWQVHRETRGLALGASEAVRADAALAVTSWRALYGPCEFEDRWPLIEELRRSPLADAAAVRRFMLGDDTAIVPAAAIDADVVFGAALITGDVDRLTAATQSDDSLQRFAAASKLAKIGALGPVREVLLRASTEDQLRLLREIESRKKPVPPLRDVLLEIAETTADERVRKSACCALCYGCPAEEGLRVARAARGERTVYQAILQRADLPPDRLEQFGVFLVESGAFSAGQWGMDAIAKEGRMPAGFVSKYWTEADDSTRVEFCKFAEMQLAEYADEGLHRFLVSVVFGLESVEVVLAAWTCLFRWYGRSDHSGMGPLLIQAEALSRFFGSTGGFVCTLNRFLRRADLVDIVNGSNRDRLAKFLRYWEANALPGFVAEQPAVGDLVDAVAAMMAKSEFDFLIRLAGADFLALLGSAPVFRAQIAVVLKGFQGTDLDLASTNALQRIAAAGI
ncbi:MAG: zinc ribbon domain-containing protein [Bryobacteraceae bacterium]